MWIGLPARSGKPWYRFPAITAEGAAHPELGNRQDLDATTPQSGNGRDERWRQFRLPARSRYLPKTGAALKGVLPKRILFCGVGRDGVTKRPDAR